MWSNKGGRFKFGVSSPMAAFTTKKGQICWVQNGVIRCGSPRDVCSQEVIVGDNNPQYPGFYGETLIVKPHQGAAFALCADNEDAIPFPLDEKTPYEIRGNIFRVQQRGRNTFYWWHDGKGEVIETGFVAQWGTWSNGFWVAGIDTAVVFGLDGRLVAAIKHGSAYEISDMEVCNDRVIALMPNERMAITYTLSGEKVFEVVLPELLKMEYPVFVEERDFVVGSTVYTITSHTTLETTDVRSEK